MKRFTPAQEHPSLYTEADLLPRTLGFFLPQTNAASIWFRLNCLKRQDEAIAVSGTRHVTDRRLLHRAAHCTCGRSLFLQSRACSDPQMFQNWEPDCRKRQSGRRLECLAAEKTFFCFSRSRRDSVRRILREKLSARRNGRDHVDQDTIWILRDEMALAERFVLQGQKNG